MHDVACGAGRAARRLRWLGIVALTLLLAACGIVGSDSGPTPTPDDVLAIVTPTPGTPPPHTPEPAVAGVPLLPGAGQGRDRPVRGDLPQPLPADHLDEEQAAVRGEVHRERLHELRLGRLRAIAAGPAAGDEDNLVCVNRGGHEKD